MLFILLFLSACNGKRVETRSALEKMLESRIHLPKEVRCVYEGEEIEILSRYEVIPGDAQYHTMYIGKDSRVKMVGDPTAGEKIKEVFDCVNNYYIL